MTNKGIFLSVIVVVALAIGGWFLLRTPAVAPVDINNDGVIDEKDKQEGPTENEMVQIHEDVRLMTPRAGETVRSPLVVKGEAAGWYFEASFPVKLISPSGKVLAQAPAQAQGDWMTTNFVPFEARLEFISTEEGMGKLVLEKDNPSGLPQYDESVEVLVKFTKTETMSVKAFFSPADIGDNCSLVSAVTRTVPKTLATAQAAIKELLKGPTATETATGFTTNIPEGVILKGLEIKDGTAYVDFSDGMSGGSCRTTAIGAQITQTLKQFPTIKNVVISAKTSSDPDNVLQP